MSKRVARDWGYYVEYFRSKHVCFKKLVVSGVLRRQRHKHRYELWFCPPIWFYLVKPNEWHSLIGPITLWELQFGTDVRESDIERL